MTMQEKKLNAQYLREYDATQAAKANSQSSSVLPTYNPIHGNVAGESKRFQLVKAQMAESASGKQRSQSTRSQSQFGQSPPISRPRYEAGSGQAYQPTGSSRM